MLKLKPLAQISPSLQDMEAFKLYIPRSLGESFKVICSPSRKNICNFLFESKQFNVEGWFEGRIHLSVRFP